MALSGGTVPFGMSVKDQRDWLAFERMRYTRAWLLAFPDLQWIKVYWNKAETAWTTCERSKG